MLISIHGAGQELAALEELELLLLLKLDDELMDELDDELLLEEKKEHSSQAPSHGPLTILCRVWSKSCSSMQ